MRPDPPTLAEQQADVTRQQELKILARAADERWAAKPSVLDRPKNASPRLRDGAAVQGSGATEEGASRKRGAGRSVALEEAGRGETSKSPRAKEQTDQAGQQRDSKEDLWDAKQRRSGERWQPEASKPGEAPKKLT